MLKEKWSIVLRKGFIISLSVFLTLSFALFSGGKKVYAISSVSKTLTHYYVSISQDSSVGSGNDYILISWTPKTTDDSAYITRATFTFSTSTSVTVQYRLYLYGTDSIMITNMNNDVSISSSNPAVAEVHYNTGSDLSLLTEELSYIDNLEDIAINIEARIDVVNSFLTNMYTSGIPSRQYDIPLECVPIYSYFSLHGGLAQYQASNLFLGQSVSFNDYLIYKGYNNPTDGNTGYLTAYAGEEYVFVFGLNTNTQMIQEGRMTLLYRDNQSTFNITKRTQRSHGQTLHVSAFFGHSNEDYAANKNSAFTLNFTLNRFEDYQYIPIYWGMVKYAPDYVWTLLQLPNPNLNEEEADNTVSDLDDVNTDLNNEISTVDDIQNQLEDDFQDNIQAIDTNINFEALFGQKFVTSAHWVRTQFETLTTQTPYGSVLFFALTLGLALMIIGRVI